MENKQTEKICTGCGRSSLRPVSEQHLACCPDNNYVTMSNNKQSSIEWLAIAIYEKFKMEGNGNELNDLVDQAKAMHKEEIIEAHDEGEGKIIGNGLQYYNETFGGNNGKALDN
jgi:hypothetical protein